MALLKYISIIAIVLAVSATANYNYDPIFIEQINDVVLVQKSSTCVILVVNSQIKFVSTEGNAPKEVAKFRKALKGKHLEIIKTTFEPLNTNDVVEKLGKIGKEHDTFLVYFTATSKSPNGTITIEKERPVGLLGNLLASLGINVNDEGLVGILLSVLGLGATVTDVITVEY